MENKNIILGDGTKVGFGTLENRGLIKEGSNRISRTAKKNLKKILEIDAHKVDTNTSKGLSEEYMNKISESRELWKMFLSDSGIKKITVGSGYTRKGLDMITNISELISTFGVKINKEIDYELSYNQACNAFNQAAEELEILQIDKKPTHVKKVEAIIVKNLTNVNFPSVEVTFTSGEKETLVHTNTIKTKRGDKFILTYLDEGNEVLEIEQVDELGNRLSSRVTKKYIDLQNDISNDNVEIVYNDGKIESNKKNYGRDSH